MFSLTLALITWGCGGPPAGPDVEEDQSQNETQDDTQVPATPTNPDAPVVDAGSDRTVVVGQMVTIRGAVTNNPNGSYTYQWTQTSGPVAGINGADTAEMSFVPGEPGIYTFELTASDETVSGTDTVTVTANAVTENLAPVAQAGADRKVKTGQVVDLDGRASSDPEGNPLIYHWRQVSGTSVTLQNVDTAVATFTSPQLQAATDLVFELYVKDSGQLDAVDRVTITVEPDPAQVTQYNLAVSIVGKGTVSSPNAAYDAGTAIFLTATPDAGWIFDHWAGDAIGIMNPLALTMNANKYITAIFTEQSQVAAPVFSVASNTHFADKLKVEILCSTPDAKVYYTIDDTEPKTSSTLYTGAIELRQSVTLKARAFKNNMKPSNITTADYYAMLVPGS